MKAILEFDLPEDKFEFDMAATAGKWAFAMWDLDQHLRSELKYGSDNWSEEKFQAYEELREKLREYLSNHGLSFDMIE